MRRSLTPLDALAERADEYRRRLLADQYSDLIVEVCELLPLADHPNPPAPRLTKRLAELETLSGRRALHGTLTARDVLAIARRRARG